jgi:hypothetical protein
LNEYEQGLEQDTVPVEIENTPQKVQVGQDVGLPKKYDMFDLTSDD